MSLNLGLILGKMPPKVADITARKEKPQNQEAIVQPEVLEKPAGLEVAPTVNVEEVPAFPAEGKVTEEKGAETFAPPVPAASAPAAAKSQTLEKIEDILEEDLEDIYFQLPPEKQAEFRKAGEETATKIDALLKDVRGNLRKVLDLIIKWLKIIPGVNKFFLEQEAKIKTDEILKLKEEEQKH